MPTDSSTAAANSAAKPSVGSRLAPLMSIRYVAASQVAPPATSAPIQPPCTYGMASVRSALRRNAIIAMTISSRSEEHTSELQSLMRISYAVFCLKKKNKTRKMTTINNIDSTTELHNMYGASEKTQIASTRSED